MDSTLIKRIEESFDFAQSILGDDFISPYNLWPKFMGGTTHYTDSLIEQFVATLPSQEVLEWCRDNNSMLVAGPCKVLSFWELQYLLKDCFCPGGGYFREKKLHANADRVDPQWIIHRKEPVAESISKNWDEQQKLLAGIEVTPNVTESSWCFASYKEVRKTYLLGSTYVRTSSLTEDGRHLYLGHFDFNGLYVDSCSNELRSDSIGIAAAIRSI